MRHSHMNNVVLLSGLEHPEKMKEKLSEYIFASYITIN